MRSLPSPERRFPFDAQAGTLPLPLPDCHLVRTAIPYLLVLRQPRCFPLRHDPALMQTDFQGDIVLTPRPWRRTLGSPFPTCPRKAGYTAHSVHGVKPGSTAMQVHIRYRTEVSYHMGSTLLHNIRSPQQQGLDLYAIKDCPEAAGITPSPSIHPRLGVRSRHQRFHRCALQRIFRPFPESG